MGRIERLADLIQDMMESARVSSERRSEVAARIRAEARTRKPKRKPPDSGLPVPAVPPRGPLPKQGGAEAPLTFD